MKPKPQDVIEARATVRVVLTALFAHAILAGLPDDAEYRPDVTMDTAEEHADELLKRIEPFLERWAASA